MQVVRVGTCYPGWFLVVPGVPGSDTERDRRQTVTIDTDKDVTVTDYRTCSHAQVVVVGREDSGEGLYLTRTGGLLKRRGKVWTSFSHMLDQPPSINLEITARRI